MTNYAQGRLPVAAMIAQFHCFQRGVARPTRDLAMASTPRHDLSERVADCNENT